MRIHCILIFFALFFFYADSNDRFTILDNGKRKLVCNNKEEFGIILKYSERDSLLISNTKYLRPLKELPEALGLKRRVDMEKAQKVQKENNELIELRKTVDTLSELQKRTANELQLVKSQLNSSVKPQLSMIANVQPIKKQETKHVKTAFELKLLNEQKQEDTLGWILSIIRDKKVFKGDGIVQSRNSYTKKKNSKNMGDIPEIKTRAELIPLIEKSDKLFNQNAKNLINSDADYGKIMTSIIRSDFTNKRAELLDQLGK